MCKYVHEAAGFGCPPHIFATNSVESVNSLLKKKVDFKELEWTSFNNQLQKTHQRSKTGSHTCTLESWRILLSSSVSSFMCWFAGVDETKKDTCF